MKLQEIIQGYHTKQAIIAFVVEKMREQGAGSFEVNAPGAGNKEPAASRAQCLYRGPEGRKCGIGHLIADEDYNPEWDEGVGKSVYDIVLAWAPSGGCIDGRFISGAERAWLPFLSWLQSCHDVAAAQTVRSGEDFFTGFLRRTTEVTEATPSTATATATLSTMTTVYKKETQV